MSLGLSNWFNRNSDSELNEQLLRLVSQESGWNRVYALMLIFSTIIATLGLLINSTAVVIGAMLIAPLFWPVMGAAVGMVTSRRHLAGRSFITLLASVVLVLVTSFLVAKLTPFTQVTDEIAARSNPTLLDLVIALAVSVIGVLAVYYPRISHSATGVALAIALLPPLCVSGIGLAFGSMEIFWRALLLFSSTVAAMVLVGIVTLYWLGFKPKYKDEVERLRIGFVGSLIIVVLLSVPLYWYLKETLNQGKIRSDLLNELEAEVKALSPQARLGSQRVRFERGGVEVEANVFLPEGSKVTVEEKEMILDRLSRVAGDSVELQLNLVNTLILTKIEDQQELELKRDIEARVKEMVNEDDLYVQSVSVKFENMFQEGIWVGVGLKKTGLENVPSDLVNRLERLLESEFGQDFYLEVEVLPVYVLDQENNLKDEERIKLVVDTYLRGMGIEAGVGEVAAGIPTNKDADDPVKAIWVVVYSERQLDLNEEQKALLIKELESEFGQKIELSIQGVVATSL